MKKSFLTFCLFAACMPLFAAELLQPGNEFNVLRFVAEKNFMLLPVQDTAPEADVYVVYANGQQGERMKVRLARERVEYYVPFDIKAYKGREISVCMTPVPEGMVCWDSIRFADEFEPLPCKYRPSGHFVPPYGWINDPNGMIYRNGEYHLFYQYNPYGCTWGNMHWGHAVSTNLTDWEHLPVALAPDAWGGIFSGSCVQKQDTVFAFYTSAGARQTQSMAYSTDGGRTFTKYAGNPVIFSNVPDFRDPKLIWYAPDSVWIMVLAAGQQMDFYKSENLRQWEYLSSFGKGYGCHDGVWECPDLLCFNAGGKNEKWVLFCNINPGGPAGGSATQYFTGSFNGREFVCDSDSSVTKWLDYGKDHYAAVTFTDAPDDRKISMAWMNNWQYAPLVPATHYRSAMTLPRDLQLFRHKGGYYLSSMPSKEVQDLPHYEISITVPKKSKAGLELKFSNAAGEYVTIKYDFAADTVVMDRAHSGITGFSDDFPVPTAAPLLDESGRYKLTVYLSASSVEAFGGTWCMTNNVYPSAPYDTFTYTTTDKSVKVEYELKSNTK